MMGLIFIKEDDRLPEYIEDDDALEDESLDITQDTADFVLITRDTICWYSRPILVSIQPEESNNL